MAPDASATYVLASASARTSTEMHHASIHELGLLNIAF
jgi:hypothetical protein